jgi:hypothetical protein
VCRRRHVVPHDQVRQQRRHARAPPPAGLLNAPTAKEIRPMPFRLVFGRFSFRSTWRASGRSRSDRTRG